MNIVYVSQIMVFYEVIYTARVLVGPACQPQLVFALIRTDKQRRYASPDPT